MGDVFPKFIGLRKLRNVVIVIEGRTKTIKELINEWVTALGN